MALKISDRLSRIVEALPLKEGMRILEIGCGPGVAAKAIAGRFDKVYVLAIDRSEKAIRQAVKNAGEEIGKGKLAFRVARIEEFAQEESAGLFDLAFAVRVGALDGRHPEIEEASLRNIRRMLKPEGRLFIDGGDPLTEVRL